ncbi:unnamed protein product, partial [Rotaria sordida]
AAERRRLEQERAAAARRRLQQEEAAATKIQASYRGFKDRQAFNERKRSSQIFTRSSSIGSTSYPDSSNTTQEETLRLKQEPTTSIDSSASSILSIKYQRKRARSNLSTHSKTQETVVTEPF